MKNSWKSGFYLLVIVMLFPVVHGFAQDGATASNRKLVTHSNPTYPTLARSLNISGTVKIEATVGANGNVKSIDVKGGNPVLAQSAESAVRGWKWEKSDRDSVEVLEIKFNP